MTEDESNENIEDSDKNMIVLPSDMKDPNPEQLEIHWVPDDWQNPPTKTEKNEPEFKDIDNPGDWSSFSFRPVKKK